MRGSYFPRPILQFKNGTSIMPYQGFKNDFKPFKGPKNIDIAALVPEGFIDDFKKLWDALWNGIRGYGGLQKWFSLEGNSEVEILRVQNYDYVETIQTSAPEDIDLFIIVVPDKMMVPYDKDPYIPYKQELSKRGFPSQMIAESTVKFGFSNPYLLLNLALSIFAKAGGIPWTLKNKLKTDIFIGIDSIQINNSRIFVFNTIYDINKSVGIFWELIKSESRSEKMQEEMLKTNIVSIIGTIRKSNPDYKINRITIHRDGLPFLEEINGVRSAIEHLKSSEILPESVEYSFVCVKKHRTPKIFRAYSNKYGNPEKGLYFILGYEMGMVLTTGFPEFSPFAPTGRVNPLEVEVAYANFEFDIREIMKEIYYLSELHWASGLRSAKLPISILYADRIARFAYLNVIPSERLKTSLWFL
ncbi:MAG: hypothetical protein J7L07_01650 [Candidatus Odinarchaeota archaeon]|nr:hypothetical protein [Candidatus Odinarchaeota archaeon]